MEPHNFIIAEEMLSQPCAFDGSSDRINLSTFCLSISTFSITDSHLGRNSGRELPVCMLQQCLANNSFNRLALVCTFVINNPFSNNGGIFIDFFY